MKKVELGCGFRKTPGYIGVDWVKFPGVDIVADLSKKFPFQDNSVDELRAHHFLEHMDYYHIMNEMWRILKPGGVVRARVPYYTNHRAFMGEHERPGFSWISFEHYRDETQPFYKYEIVRNRIIFTNNKLFGWVNSLINLFPFFYDRWLAHIIPSIELDLVLKKRKNFRPLKNN